MKKRILSLLLAVLMVLSLGVTAFASEEPAEEIQEQQTVSETEGDIAGTAAEETATAADAPAPAAYYNIASIQAAGKYQQTSARSMLYMINEFRTGPNAWYWNADNRTKTYLTDLGELQYDYALEEIAKLRAAELVVNFDHVRPDGSICFTATYNGVQSYGENIAYCYGYSNVVDTIFSGWREDNYGYSGQGHRRNMLNPGYTAVGIACFYYSGFYFWVQEFGYQVSDTPATRAVDGSSLAPSTGWQKSGGKWYYYRDNELAIGWVQSGGKWYYLAPSMMTGWKKADGAWYWFDKSSGAMAADKWVKDAGVWYYLQPDGAMAADEWIGGKYYVDASGGMVTGWKLLEGDYYYFTSSGAKVANKWVKSGSKWYYLKSDGRMAAGETVSDGGKLYCVNDMGVMLTGWISLGDGDYYYAASSGALKTSAWQKSGGKWYWLKDDGLMARNETVTVKGVEYSFDDAGVCLNP